MDGLELHGALWTVKELFVYPNEFIIWSIQIVMYPFMTGLVAGAFVLSSLYHVFGLEELKRVASFSLLFSIVLLPVGMMPLGLHIQHPLRGPEIFFTPHFTSAMAAFGIVFSVYFAIVAGEIWFVYRRFFVEQAQRLRGAARAGDRLLGLVYRVLTLGATDVGLDALATDHRAAKVLAAIGIPVACFLHGYAGFIFGSVKANALWLTPLMPVIFIMSAMVSGVALCMLSYLGLLELSRFRSPAGSDPVTVRARVRAEQASMVSLTRKYLLSFLVAAISLELLDLIFRGYTAVKSWTILGSVIYDRDFLDIFVLQYGVGNLLPLVLLLLPRPTLRRTVVALVAVLFGVFMMRWNVVIGGQSFSLTFMGYMHYHLPLVPESLETLKEGLVGALSVVAAPFVLLWLVSFVIPVVPKPDDAEA